MTNKNQPQPLTFNQLEDFMRETFGLNHVIKHDDHNGFSADFQGFIPKTFSNPPLDFTQGHVPNSAILQKALFFPKEDRCFNTVTSYQHALIDLMNKGLLYLFTNSPSPRSTLSIVGIHNQQFTVFKQQR